MEDGDIAIAFVKDLGLALAPKMCPDQSDLQRGQIFIGILLDQTLWYHFVARSSSSQQHGAKENVCTPCMETNVAPLRSQDLKIQQKGVSRHDLTPEIIVVARTIPGTP